jgi:hypothetical protein
MTVGDRVWFRNPNDYWQRVRATNGASDGDVAAKVATVHPGGWVEMVWEPPLAEPLQERLPRRKHEKRSDPPLWIALHYAHVDELYVVEAARA